MTGFPSALDEETIAMIKAVNYWTFGPEALGGEYDIVQAMQEAKAAGFAGIELCLGTTGRLTFDVSEQECAALRSAAKRIGIKITSVATGLYWGVSPTSDKKEDRDQALALTKKALQITKWLGTDAFLYIPGVVKPEFDPKAPVVPYGEVYKRALAQAKALAKVAEKLKVNLCCENVWNMFLYSPVEMKDFIERVGSRYVGCYFDPANVVKNGYADHWVPVLGKKIKRVHCKDYSRAIGGFPAGFSIPIGPGDTGWKTILAQLKAAGYKGPVTAEIITFEKVPGLVERTSREMDAILEG